MAASTSVSCAEDKAKCCAGRLLSNFSVTCATGAPAPHAPPLPPARATTAQSSARSRLGAAGDGALDAGDEDEDIIASSAAASAAMSDALASVWRERDCESERPSQPKARARDSTACAALPGGPNAPSTPPPGGGKEALDKPKWRDEGAERRKASIGETWGGI